MILLLAGTSDARELAICIKNRSYELLASVVTENAAISLRENDIRTHVGRLTVETMRELCRNENVSIIVDATHPFAEEASKNAIQAAKTVGIPYLRYERKSYEEQDSLITKVDTYEDAAEEAANHGGVIMLTTGSKTLEIFANRLNHLPNVRLLARMLPRKDNMEKCERLGVEQKNIIAMQGPFSKQLNKALYEQYEVDLVITKESGKIGSVDEKIAAARELNIPVIMIKRPKIKYENVFSNFDQVIEALEKIKER